MVVLLIAAVLLVAFANGANDNAKGVATLVGSRMAASSPPCQVGVWVEAVVARAHVDIVDVEQEPAAGAPRERGQELPFGDRRTAVFEITRDVFDEDAAAEILLVRAGRAPLEYLHHEI